MIGVDWGTSRMRAWHWSDARLLDTAESGMGLLAVRQRASQQGLTISAAFEQAAMEMLGPWLERTPSAERQVVLCGMAGSRQGWAEAPYVDCPASLKRLAAQCLTLEPASALAASAQWKLVPGVCSRQPADIMRGEETQLIGIASTVQVQGACRVVMPGTHSKHVDFDLSEQSISGFSTYFTGELFSLLTQHSLLAASITSERMDHPTFTAAVRTGAHELPQSGALSSEIFRVRARQLLGQLPDELTHCWLSGLLIGHELQQLQATAAQLPLVLVGNSELTERYRLALAALELPAPILAPHDAAARGLLAIGAELFS